MTSHDYLLFGRQIISSEANPLFLINIEPTLTGGFFIAYSFL